MNNIHDEQMNFPVEWIMSKSFDELTDKEQAQVLASITRTEYDNMHDAFLHTINILHNEDKEPAADIHDKLLAAFDNERTKPAYTNMLHAIWNYKLPAYQAVAAVVLTALLAIAGHYFNSTVIPAQHIQYVDRRDTVYIPIEGKETIDKESATHMQDSNLLKDRSDIQSSHVEGVKNIDTYGLCRSLKRDSSLKQFMIAVNVKSTAIYN